MYLLDSANGSLRFRNRPTFGLLCVFLILQAAAVTPASARAGTSEAVLSTVSVTRPASADGKGANVADLNAAPSADVRAIEDWIVGTADNAGLPFIIVDKASARLFLFDEQGSVRTTTAVLLGAGRGDDSPAGIGDEKLSAMAPAERITPAGRFVAERGENLSGQDILWIDYAAAISLHRATDVKPGLTARSRLARLASASLTRRRVSHGCINVSVKFYDNFIRTTFNASPGVVYILPETRPLSEVFPKAVAWRQAYYARPAQGNQG